MHMLLTLLPLLAPLAAAPDIDFVGEEVLLPMDLTTGHVAVMVRLNGGEPLLFQVDTYASIDDDVAEALGLETVGTVQNFDGVTRRERNIVEIAQLQCGGATFKNMRTLVDDYDWLKRSDGKKVAGLIGFTAFQDLLVTFDYPAEVLVLRRGNLEPEGLHVIPFTSPSGSPDIDLVFGGRELRFGIDTGHQSALTLHKSDAAGLGLEDSLRVVGTARSASSSLDIWGAPYPQTVGLAGHTVSGLNLRFTESNGGRLIGYELLKGYTMTFDQERKLVSLMAGDS